MLRILNAEALNYSEEARLILNSIGVLDEYEIMSRSDLLHIVRNYDVLIVRLNFQVDREVIDAGSRLKVIVTAATGLDHIDVTYAQENGIKILGLRGQTEFLRSIPATAEHSWTLLLALVRRIPWAFLSVLTQEWDRDRFRGHDLSGQSLGVVGLGRIGEKVARYGQAFNMIVRAYDPYLESPPSGVQMVPSLSELLASSTVLSLHVPLNDATVDMINADALALMPTNAVLINTSRGRIVNEGALIAALEAGTIAGAAVDVIANEQALASGEANPLITYARSHTNLLITPHIGGATIESMAVTEIFMARQLAKYIELEQQHAR